MSKTMMFPPPPPAGRSAACAAPITTRVRMSADAIVLNVFMAFLLSLNSGRNVTMLNIDVDLQTKDRAPKKSLLSAQYAAQCTFFTGLYTLGGLRKEI
jgi:hypothetical protein